MFPISICSHFFIMTKKIKKHPESLTFFFCLCRALLAALALLTGLGSELLMKSSSSSTSLLSMIPAAVRSES